MNWPKIGRILLFVILTLLFLSELIFSSLGGLLGDTASLATDAGVVTGSLRIYLLILAFLDALGGVLALIALWNAFRDKDNPRNLRMLTGLTFAYAVYQLLAGLFLLGPNLRTAYIGIGVTYAVLAGLVWLVQRNQDQN